MSNIRSYLQRHSLIAGLILMFLFTWPIDLANAGILPVKFPFVVYLFLGYGFVFASILMTGLTMGWDAVARLLRRFLIWRVGWQWYLVAFLLLPLIFFSAVFLNSDFMHSPVDFSTSMAHKIFGQSANLWFFVLPFFLVDALTNGEEIGWRGYVLPRLQVQHSAFVSSLIIGLIWGVWHLPKFLGAGNLSSFPLYILKTLVEAVLYTWLYNNTNGSLLLVTIFHTAGNTAGVFLPVPTTASVGDRSVLVFILVLEIFAAFVVTITAGSKNLSRKASPQVQKLYHV